MVAYDDALEHGIKPESDLSMVLQMSHPSLKDHLRDMTHFERLIEGYNDDRVETTRRAVAAGEFVLPNDLAYFETKDKMIADSLAKMKIGEAFFRARSAFLGGVFAASGDVVINVQGRDWALIEVVDSRHSRNTVRLPECSTCILLTTLSVQLPQDARRDFLLHGDVLQQPDGELPGHQDLLGKVGRTTGYTVGRYNAIEASILTRPRASSEAVVTHEHQVVLYAQQVFTEKGDSGSFVFDKHSRFVGMLVCGTTEGCGFFTPAKVLFADIMRVTGAEAVRVPELV